MSRLHWFGLRIWFCTLQLAEKASCTDPAVIPGCIEQVYLYKPSVPIRPIEAICTKPGWYSRLAVQNSGVGLHVKLRRPPSSVPSAGKTVRAKARGR